MRIFATLLFGFAACVTSVEGGDLDAENLTMPNIEGCFARSGS